MVKELVDNGVELFLDDGVQSFREVEQGICVVLQSGWEMDANLVILAIGVKSDKDFLGDADIELGGV